MLKAVDSQALSIEIPPRDIAIGDIVIGDIAIGDIAIGNISQCFSVDITKYSSLLYSNRYQVTSSLMKSLFGEILVAMDLLTSQKVAIKCSSIGLLSGKKTIKGQKVFEDVRREVNILRYLKHCDLQTLSGVCNLVEELEDENYHYIITEYAEKGDLFNILAKQPKGRFSESTAKPLFHSLVSQILVLHKNHIAHFDISPENICIDKNENIRLIDMALSIIHPWYINLNADVSATLRTIPYKMIRNSNPNSTSCKRSFLCERMPNRSSRPGKTLYMSPELWQGYDWDAFACDDWALGTILYLMLTGHPAVSKSDESDAWYNILISGRWIESLSSPNPDPGLHVCSHLSSSALDLINKILKPQCKRLTCEQILEHEWFHNDTLPIVKENHHI